MKSYPEIEALRNYFNQFNIEIIELDEFIRRDFYFVNLSIDGQSWKILVDDEYQDFSRNILFALFLVFNSLEAYRESDDFMTWSKQNSLDPSNMNYLDYYRTLDSIYMEIQKKIGKIDPCISPFDYNLRTGVIQALMNNNT